MLLTSFAASALPPCARGGARQPGSISRGVLQIRPGAPNGTKVGVRRGLQAPHRRRAARGCSWSAAPRLAGFSSQSRIINPPSRKQPLKLQRERAVGDGAFPSTLTELPCSSGSGHAPRQGVWSVSASPILRFEHRGSQVQKGKTSTAVVGTCGLQTKQPCIPSLRLADAKSIGLFGRRLSVSHFNIDVCQMKQISAASSP